MASERGLFDDAEAWFRKALDAPSSTATGRIWR